MGTPPGNLHCQLNLLQTSADNRWRSGDQGGIFFSPSCINQNQPWGGNNNKSRQLNWFSTYPVQEWSPCRKSAKKTSIKVKLGKYSVLKHQPVFRVKLSSQYTLWRPYLHTCHDLMTLACKVGIRSEDWSQLTVRVSNETRAGFHAARMFWNNDNAHRY